MSKGLKNQITRYKLIIVDIRIVYRGFCPEVTDVITNHRIAMGCLSKAALIKRVMSGAMFALLVGKDNLN